MVNINYLPLMKLFTVSNNCLPLREMFNVIKLFNVNKYFLPLINIRNIWKLLTVNKNIYR